MPLVVVRGWGGDDHHHHHQQEDAEEGAGAHLALAESRNRIQPRLRMLEHWDFHLLYLRLRKSHDLEVDHAVVDTCNVLRLELESGCLMRT